MKPEAVLFMWISLIVAIEAYASPVPAAGSAPQQRSIALDALPPDPPTGTGDFYAELVPGIL